jgi:ribonuclease BN (tRNA processing enzyme)
MPSILTLTVLGTGTPHPRPDQPCSGYLVASATAKLWMEAGSGTFAALQRYTELDQLDALWFSHMHPDHVGDLPALASWLLNRSGQPSPLAVYGPQGWMGRLSAFLPTRPELLQRQIDAYELFDGHTTVVGDLQLTSRAVHHSIQSFGLRIELGSRALVYSGDTGPCTRLNELANRADLFLCEAGASAHPDDDRQPAHCTPEDAAHAARQASVKRLLLTHLAPSLQPDSALMRAADIYRETTLATPGMVQEL